MFGHSKHSLFLCTMNEEYTYGDVKGEILSKALMHLYTQLYPKACVRGLTPQNQGRMYHCQDTIGIYFY